jgi:hypothetical protein
MSDAQQEKDEAIKEAMREIEESHWQHHEAERLRRQREDSDAQRRNSTKY